MQHRKGRSSGLRRRGMRQSHIRRSFGMMTSLVHGTLCFINSLPRVARSLVGAASMLRLKHDIASMEVNLSRKGIQSIYQHYGAPVLKSNELMSLSRASSAQELSASSDV